MRQEWGRKWVTFLTTIIISNMREAGENTNET
jgi:hypothetical protein